MPSAVWAAWAALAALLLCLPHTHSSSADLHVHITHFDCQPVADTGYYSLCTPTCAGRSAMLRACRFTVPHGCCHASPLCELDTSKVPKFISKQHCWVSREVHHIRGGSGSTDDAGAIMQEHSASGSLMRAYTRILLPVSTARYPHTLETLATPVEYTHGIAISEIPLAHRLPSLPAKETRHANNQTPPHNDAAGSAEQQQQVQHKENNKEQKEQRQEHLQQQQQKDEDTREGWCTGKIQKALAGKRRGRPFGCVLKCVCVCV